MDNTSQTENKEQKQMKPTFDKTRYKVNLIFKKDGAETYKDKVLKLF